MAVTTTYSLQFVQNTDLPQGPIESQADATSLANGGFAVIGSHVGHTDLDVFGADLSDDGGNNVFTGTNSAIDQLANGNLAYVTEDADSIQFGIRNASGGVVLAQTDLGDIDSSNADVAALTGGRFVIVNEDDLGAVGGDADIDVRIRNADGTAASTFTISFSPDRDTNASVAALDNGNFVVAWQRDAGAETEIWYAVYNSGGGVVQAQTLVDSTGTINRNVDVSAKAGGFVLAYEDNGWGTGSTDITLAEYTSDGTFQSFSNISNPSFTNDGSDDANAVVTRLSNNLLVVGFEDNTFSDTDTNVTLFDAGTNMNLTTRNITGGESVVDDVGDITIAGSAGGRINVFQTNNTDSDVDGETLQGRRTSTSDGAGDVIIGDEFIDVMQGNDGDDTLSGDGGNDSLNGGNGNDYVSGGAGADNLDGGGDLHDALLYETSNAAVTVNLQTGVVSGGHASGDVIINFENVFGSSHADSLTGTSGNNILNGGANADSLNGGLGNDTLIGGTSGDTLNGGSGLSDVADYAASNAAVTVSIGAVPAASGGHAAGDSFIGIENLTGSIFGDTLTGNSVRNTLRGGDGADTLNASSNADWLYGGNGDDELLGGTGADIIDGGANVDTVSFTNAAARIILTLVGGAGTATGSGQGTGDVITAVENITGSAFNDFLTGDANANTILGGLGNDTLNGGGGADIISGQGGLDSLNGGAGNDTLTGGSEADTFVYSISALWDDDTIIGWQNGTDRIDLVGAGFDFTDFTETQDGADTLLTLTANPAHTIRLIGINANSIDAADFV